MAGSLAVAPGSRGCIHGLLCNLDGTFLVGYIHLVLVCEALADDHRVRIVELLARDDMTAGDIAEQFTVSRPAISKHLKVLRDAGLVTVTAQANKRIYRLDPRPLGELLTWADAQWQAWEARLDALERHLKAKERRQNKKG